MSVCLALLMPAVAAAAEPQEPALMTFTAEGTHGYEMWALAGLPLEGAGPEEGYVGLWVTRGVNRGVTYAVSHATVTRKRIQADLGALGKISLTRAPTGRSKVVHARCLPDGRSRVEIDRFEGTIEFHGEEGFTSIDATNVPGATHSSFCGIPEGGRPAGAELPGAELRVEEPGTGEFDVTLRAVQERPGEKTWIDAEVQEERDEIEIHRFAGVRAPAAALTFDGRLRGATLKPPPPFAGFGHFAARSGAGEPDSGTWSGNLTVDVPGNAGVRIGGPGFNAELRHPSL